MRIKFKYHILLALVALVALVGALWSEARLGAAVAIPQISPADTGPEFINDINTAFSLIQSNFTTLTPNVIAPAITNLGSVSGSVTCNVSQSSGCVMTLAGPVSSFAITGGTPGQLITLQIRQSSSGGASFSWPANVQWSGAPPATDPTPGAVEMYQLQTFDGVTWYPLVHSSLSGNSITGTGYLPTIVGFNGEVQSALNVIAYGASASLESASATVSAGSTSVTLNTPADFQNGQSVVLLHAGPATSLATPAAPTITVAGENSTAGAYLEAELNVGRCTTDSAGLATSNANCSTSYTYQVVNVDAMGGMSAPSPKATISNGPATLSMANRLVVTWAQDPNAVATLVYGCAGANCTPTLRAVVPALPSLASYWNNYVSGSVYGYVDVGGPYFGYDEVYGTSVPPGAVNQNLLATITSGAGTTSIVLSAAPSVSGTVTMYHDDAPAFQAAIHDACGPVTNSAPVNYARTIYIPAGAYPFGETIDSYGCTSIYLEGAGGGAALNTSLSPWIIWHGPIGGVAIDLNKSAGIEVKNLSFPSAPNLGGTVGIAINIDNVTTSATTDAGGHTIVSSNPQPGQTLGQVSSGNRIEKIFVGDAGVGISVGRQGGTLNSEMKFEDVQMAAFGSPGGGWLGYYLGGGGASGALRLKGGEASNRVFGILLNNPGSVRASSLSFALNATDIYSVATIGSTAGIFEEDQAWSSGAQHHFYSAVVNLPQNARIEGSHLAVIGPDNVDHGVPSRFYLMPGAGGVFSLHGNSICMNEPQCLVAVSTQSGNSQRTFSSLIVSENNLYSSQTPWFPAPNQSNTGAGARVQSLNDLFAPNNWLATNPSGPPEVSEALLTGPGAALFGGTTELKVVSLTPNAPTVTPNATGSTTYTYWVYCTGYQGEYSQLSAPTTITNGPSSLSSSSTITLQTSYQPGCQNYYWLRNNTSTLAGVSPNPYFVDTGASSSTSYPPASGDPMGTLRAGGITASGAINIAGTQTNGADQISHVNVMREVDVTTFGAKCDGVTDDTAAIQNAINYALQNKRRVVIPGTCVVSHLNITPEFTTYGDPGFKIRGNGPNDSEILCEEPSGNSGVCIDALGVNGDIWENLRIEGGTSPSNAPYIVLLQGKLCQGSNVASAGTVHTMRNVLIDTYGSFGIYNYGAEQTDYDDMFFNCANSTSGSNCTALLVLSSANSYGVTVPSGDLPSGWNICPAPQSMSMVQIHGGQTTFGIYNSTAGAIVFDDNVSGSAVEGISLDSVYFNSSSLGGNAAISCTATSSTGTQVETGIHIERANMEAYSVLSQFINCPNSAWWDSDIHATLGLNGGIAQYMTLNYLYDSDVRVWVPGYNNDHLVGGILGTSNPSYGTHIHIGQFQNQINYAGSGWVLDESYPNINGQTGLTFFPQGVVLGSLRGMTVTSTLGQPPAPSVTPQGATGSTTYSYYVVCHDANGGTSIPSPAGTITNGNATLSSSNNNLIIWHCPFGYASADILKNNTSTALATGQPPTGFINDTGQATSSYTPPTRDSTADFAPSVIRQGCAGTGTLSSGSATINNSCIIGGRPIIVTGVSDSNVLYVSSNTAGSFTVKSTSSSDSSSFYWAQQ